MKLNIIAGLALLLFTGCFEIVEEMDLNPNGSGKMQVVVNMSESKENLNEYLKSGSANGIKIPDKTQLQSYLDQIQLSLNKVNGISNAGTSADFNEFIFTFTADFTDVKAMNTAVTQLTKELSNGTFSIDNKYEYSNGKFVRSFGTIISPEDYEKLPVMQRFVLESARMVSIFKFSRPVKKLSNQTAELSPGKKAVKWVSTLGDIAQGTKKAENTISF